MKISHVLIASILILSLFSGCIQNNSDGKNNIPIDNVTSKENNTTAIPQIQNYTAELDGHVYLSVLGWDSMITGVIGIDSNSGEFDVTEPKKIQLTVTYNSTFGDVIVQLLDTDPNNDGNAWYSEGDGGGTETITVTEKDMQNAEKNGTWWFGVYTGMLPPDPKNPLTVPGIGANISFSVKIVVWGCPITDAHMYQLGG